MSIPDFVHRFSSALPSASCSCMVKEWHQSKMAFLVPNTVPDHDNHNHNNNDNYYDNDNDNDNGNTNENNTVPELITVLCPCLSNNSSP